MTAFLDEQKEADDAPVLGYAFVTTDQKRLVDTISDSGHSGVLEPACEYEQVKPRIRGVPENYMDVIYTD